MCNAFVISVHRGPNPLTTQKAVNFQLLITPLNLQAAPLKLHLGFTYPPTLILKIFCASAVIMHVKMTQREAFSTGLW